MRLEPLIAHEHLRAWCLAIVEMAAAPLAGVPACLRIGLQILHDCTTGGSRDIVVMACTGQTSKAPASELLAQVQIAENKIKRLCRGAEGSHESDARVRSDVGLFLSFFIKTKKRVPNSSAF